MKVSLDILQRVYETVQEQGNASNDLDKEALDPESHLFFINAFEMPLWHWSPERGTFEM
jgi:DNA polymerase epsilon subunit 2